MMKQLTNYYFSNNRYFRTSEVSEYLTFKVC